jgi:5-methyltetrahydrofolate--homocysteine methyltransferase
MRGDEGQGRIRKGLSTMQIGTFIVVGENIHCTRIFKVGGKYVGEGADGGQVIHYAAAGGARRELPIPQRFQDGADWAAGKVKHCAVAIWQGCHGDEAGRAAGIDYLQSMALRQEADGATYLDINVDEFSTDVEERARLMAWTVDVVQQAASVPVSIDSSNVDILSAGLQACDASRGRPMVNSVSLERADAVKVAAEAGAVVVASAAGEKGLPTETAERLANLERLVAILKDAGFSVPQIHADPLVFPISVDGANGRRFLDTVTGLREAYGPELHIVAGLSNVSFGMPNRKLINQVFARLAVEHGADGGIVDPSQINGPLLAALDPQDESFQLARALLMGEDEFGMNFITAMRERRG